MQNVATINRTCRNHRVVALAKSTSGNRPKMSHEAKIATVMLMPDPNSSGTGYLHVDAVLQSMGDEAGWAQLEAIDPNMAQYTSSGSKPCKSARVGDTPSESRWRSPRCSRSKKATPWPWSFPRVASPMNSKPPG